MGDDGQRARLGLDIGAKGRLGHGVGDGRVTDDMHVRVHDRLKAAGFDRTPAPVLVKPGGAGNRRRPLRRNNIGHGRRVCVKLGTDDARPAIDLDDPSALTARHPFEQTGIQALPGGQKQPVLGKRVLGVQDQDF